MEHSVEQLWSIVGPIEFGSKKSLLFRVDYVSLVFMKFDTLMYQLMKFQIPLRKLKNKNFWRNIVLLNKDASLLQDCAMFL